MTRLPDFGQTALFKWVEESFSGARRGVEDTAISLLPQIVNLLSGIIVSILMARGLGPVGMGEFALITSISGLTAILSDLGIGNTAVHYASRSASQGNTSLQFEVLRWAFRLRMVFVFVITVSIYFCIPTVSQYVWHAENLSYLMRLSLMIGIFGALSSIPAIYFQSMKLFKMSAVVTIGQTLILTIGIVGIALLNIWTLEAIIIISILAAGIGAISFQFVTPGRTLFDWDELRGLFKKGIVHIIKAPRFNLSGSGQSGPGDIHTFTVFMILSAVTLQIALRADVWLMGYFLDKGEIGLYNVATKYVLPLSMALGAISTAFWPHAAAITSRESAINILNKTFRLSSITAGAALIYTATAPLTASFLFGASYAGSIILAQLLCLRYCISILLFHFGIIGYSLGLVKLYFWINLFQMSIVIAGNIFFLPKIGAIGAAITLLIYEIVGSLIIIIAVRGAINRLKANPVGELK
jgi:O-antigen/teichoic acid export membrane protein